MLSEDLAGEWSLITLNEALVQGMVPRHSEAMPKNPGELLVQY